MAKTGPSGRPAQVRRSLSASGKVRVRAEKEIFRNSERHRFSAVAETEPAALIDVAVQVHHAGFVSEAKAIGEWVRAAGWMTHPMPSFLGVEDAPVDRGDASKHRFDGIMDGWLTARRADVGRKKLASGTHARDRYRIKNYIRPHFGDVFIEDVSRRDVVAFLDGLADLAPKRRERNPQTRELQDHNPDARRLGPSPLRDLHSVLNMLFDHARANEVSVENPMPSIPRAKRNDTLENRADAFADFEKLNRAVFEVHPDLLDPLDRVAARQFRLAFFGLRQSERLGISRSSIRDSSAGTVLVIDRQLAPNEGGTTERLKSQSSRRAFLVPASLAAYLDELIAWRRTVGEPGADDLLICRPDGKAIRHQDDNEAWQALLERHGIRRWRGHLLRHWAATQVANAGAAETDARAFLGHSSVMMTRFYTERNSVDITPAVASISSQVIPEHAWLDALDRDVVRRIREQDPTLYHEAIVEAAGNEHGTVRTVEYLQQESEVAWSVTVDTGSGGLTARRRTFRGALPAGFNPENTWALVSELWRVASDTEVEAISSSDNEGPF